MLSLSNPGRGAVTVYVDDMRHPWGGMLLCHMIADSSAELLAMADRIGVSRRWIQKAGTAREHFDIALSRRALAVAAGAREIAWRDGALMCAIRAKTGQLGPPETALERWRALHGGEPTGPWAGQPEQGALPVRPASPVAHRCACGGWACFHDGGGHWCRACVPAGFLPGGLAAPMQQRDQRPLDREHEQARDQDLAGGVHGAKPRPGSWRNDGGGARAAAQGNLL